MTTPTMIRSHTGALVEARPTMIGSVVNPDSSSRFGLCRILYMDDKHLQVEHESGFSWIQPEFFTLLHAPFVVGDLVEILVDGEWIDKQRDGTSIPFDAGLLENKYIDAVRHADENLRDAPDYKPDEK